MEITYFGANYLITSKNEQQNEIRKEIPAENGPELVYQRRLYGFTPVIRSSICDQNESTPVFAIFLAFWEFQMGHAAYQIKPKTPSKLKNAIKMILNTLDSQNLAQKQKISICSVSLVAKFSICQSLRTHFRPNFQIFTQLKLIIFGSISQEQTLCQICGGIWHDFVRYSWPTAPKIEFFNGTTLPPKLRDLVNMT